MAIVAHSVPSHPCPSVCILALLARFPIPHTRDTPCGLSSPPALLRPCPGSLVTHSGYLENDQQVIEHLLAAWKADRANKIAAWNAQKEVEARAAEEAEEVRRQWEEEEEALINKEAEREQSKAEKKKPKMNIFTPGSSVADILVYPPSQYALQKLSTFNYVEMWYFSLAGRLDAAKNYDRSQVDDTFGISKVDDHLTVRSIASVRASRNALPDHELSFSKFLRAKNCFLDHTKANWPTANLDALAKFFWYLETHPSLQLPLGKRIILTYASHVCFDWHHKLKAGRGYDLSLINSRLLDTISRDIEGHDNDWVKSKASRPPPFSPPSLVLN
ncbi:hypothetical protein PAXINDRAFT_15523 [Paxillus involutus ATCC 200175]|uniref:Uncharacterized protein n=1 Tax=Paxillus involutus ATCC 200175 TaxID=664439 RepID=A0A0C9SSY6_PAXIN|nr:hypothetical protein PAXINDRAFT_15523 [Paxillus involutus ATCC 200175]